MMMYQSQFIEMFGNPLSQVQKFPLKRLGDCCELNPRRPSIALSDTDLVSFVPMPCVSENGYLQDVADEEYGKVKKGFTYFENKDVLFAKITPCMENGKGAIAQELTNGIGMGSTEFHVLRPIEGKSNSYWLLALTRMPIFRERASKNMSGTGGQKRVGASFLDNFMVGLPPIEEQNHFEELYKQADKSKFDGFKSQFIEMFGDLSINSFNWPLSYLSDVADIKIGPFGSLLHQEDYVEGGRYLINPSQIVGNKIVPDSKVAISEEKYSELSSYSLEINDIVLGRRGEMGRAGIVMTNGMICGTGSIRIRPNDPVDAFYIWQELTSDAYRQILERESVGTTMMNLNVKIVSKLQIPQLPVELKMQYTSIVEQADKSKSVCRQTIKRLAS